jgi:response regulator RpfG family c-di-GMP phosphodiesterase
VYGRVSRIAPLVQRLCQEVSDVYPWQTSAAVYLAFLGTITLPDDVIRRHKAGHTLSDQEQDALNSHPAVAFELVNRIPRLDGVAQIVLYQEKNFDGSGFPTDETAGEAIPLGARILRVATDYDDLIARAHSPEAALAVMRERSDFYDPKVIKALERVVTEQTDSYERFVFLKDLRQDMVLLEDVLSLKEGTRILTSGQVITRTMLSALRQYDASYGVAEPIKVIERRT